MAFSNKLYRHVSIVAFLLTAMPGFSQKIIGAAGMVNVGFISTKHFAASVEHLNEDSVQFGNGYTMIGADGYYRHGNTIISISGYLGVQGARTSGEKILERSLWTAHAGMGWILWNSQRFTFYPAVSFGLTGLYLTEHRQHPATYIDTIHTTIPSTDLSLHLDYLMLDTDTNDRVVNGIILGMQTGYNYGISSSTPFQGWYLTVSVGGLAFMKKKP
jgi:hypothetical protein